MSLQITFLFCVGYGFSNWLATQRSDTYQFWMNWELMIPFIPWTVLIYFSLNMLLILPLFTLEAEKIKNLGKSMRLATVIAVTVFLIFPAHIAFHRITDTPFWGPFYKFLFSLDNTANTMPSLHITYSLLTVRAIAGNQSRLKYFFWLWLIAISASVLLTHQHHVIDVLGGILLGELCYRRIFLKDVLPAQ
jgi:membrane-associated phospholipid phosphatase